MRMRILGSAYTVVFHLRYEDLTWKLFDLSNPTTQGLLALLAVGKTIVFKRA